MKSAIITLNVLTSICFGLCLQVIRDSAYSIVAVYNLFDVLPRVTKAMLFFPSHEYHARHPVFVYCLLTITFGLLLMLMSKLSTSQQAEDRGILVLSFALLNLAANTLLSFVLAVLMVYPLLPRLKILEKNPPASFASNVVTIVFCIVTVILLYRVVVLLVKRAKNRGEPGQL